MLLYTSPYRTMINNLIYIGSHIPPYIRRPPPLVEVAFASAILGGYVFSMRKEIKLLTDKTIHYIETRNFSNKPLQIFQKTFKYLKSNPITNFFFQNSILHTSCRTYVHFFYSSCHHRRYASHCAKYGC